MGEEHLKSIVEESTFEEGGRRKLACAAAFKLAEKHGIGLLEISRICHASGIKICKCQLGCFN